MNNLLNACIRSKLIYDPIKKYNNMKLYNNKGFLTFDNKKIYLNFRGTKDIKDVIDNIDIRHQSIIHHDIKVHKGFHDQFFSIEEEITQDIENIIKSYEINEIIISGHSSGGSMSQISSAYYGELLNINISTYTFGAVASGNSSFIKWFINNVKNNLRVETKGDIIPYIPVHDNFYHTPNGLNIDINGDIKINYEIKPYTYLELLKLLLDKEYIKEIYEKHSCENYINSIKALSCWNKLLTFEYQDLYKIQQKIYY
jgi:hypothetical protein